MLNIFPYIPQQIIIVLAKIFKIMRKHKLYFAVSYLKLQIFLEANHENNQLLCHAL